MKLIAALCLIASACTACGNMDTHTWESDANGPPAQMERKDKCDHDTSTKGDRDMTCPACRDKYPLE